MRYSPAAEGQHTNPLFTPSGDRVDEGEPRAAAGTKASTATADDQEKAAASGSVSDRDGRLKRSKSKESPRISLKDKEGKAVRLTRSRVPQVSFLLR